MSIIESNVDFNYKPRWRSSKVVKEMLLENGIKLKDTKNIEFPDETLVIKEGKVVLVIQYSSDEGKELFFKKCPIGIATARDDIHKSISIMKEKGFVFAEKFQEQEEYEPEMPFDYFTLVNTKRKVYFIQVMEMDKYKKLMEATEDIKMLQ